tara:strand:+ start:89 stop:265 length:177 start_codon:yes stop_codon:yes gene_type:complete
MMNTTIKATPPKSTWYVPESALRKLLGPRLDLRKKKKPKRKIRSNNKARFLADTNEKN